MIKDSYRIENAYDVQFESDNKFMHIKLNGKSLATINYNGINTSVRFYDASKSTTTPVYKFKFPDYINECPNCSQGMLHLRVSADMHYDLNRDGVVAMNQFDTETFWDDFQELYCENCGISSTSYDADKKLAYDFDEKRRKITAVGIIKKGEY